VKRNESCGASSATRRTIVVRHLRIVVSPVCGGGICEFAALLRVIEAQCRSWPDARHVRFSEKNGKPGTVDCIQKFAAGDGVLLERNARHLQWNSFEGDHRAEK
jgi:hypothetical protein